MEDYKEETKKVYEKYAQEYEINTKAYLKNYILEDAELFIRNLNGKKILDLGSGPGRDALFFKEKGLNPVCIDISLEAVNLCKTKGLESYEMDMEALKFDNNSFDGIWAYTSLLHIPKDRIDFVLIKINQILKDGGIVYTGMKEGDFEGWLESDKYPGMKRFFSLYKDEELRNIISKYFNILHTSKVNVGNATFLNYLCRKK